MKKTNNRGFQFEKDYSSFKGYKRQYSNLSHFVAGDIIDGYGNQYQLKTKDGQMTIPNGLKPTNPLKTLLSRIDNEKAEFFIVGIEKRGKWECFTFTKKGFKNLVADNEGFWKVEETSTEGVYHFRFSFSLSKGSAFTMKRYSEKVERVEISK